MSERELQEIIINDIHRTDHFWAIAVDAKPVWYKKRWIKSRAKSGMTDLLVLCRVDQRCILIEVKRPGKTLSLNQETFREDCRRNNVAHDIATSSIQALNIIHFWCRRWGLHDPALEAILPQL